MPDSWSSPLSTVLLVNECLRKCSYDLFRALCIFLFLFALAFEFVVIVDVVLQARLFGSLLLRIEGMSVLFDKHPGRGLVGFDEPFHLGEMRSPAFILEHEMRTRIGVGIDFVLDGFGDELWG